MLISDEYRTALKQTHEAAGPKGWGNTANTTYYKVIKNLIERQNSKEILDYGAGWGGLKEALNRDIPDLLVHEYEPSREDVSAPPAPCDFVVCCDVLEHVEPDMLEAVLEDLVRVTSDTAYFSIHFSKALKILPDGRNAHLIIMPFEWWLRKLSTKFYIRQARHENHTLVGGDFLLQSRTKYPR